MFALETRPPSQAASPDAFAKEPWHPETHQALDTLIITDLPDFDRVAAVPDAAGSWTPTGFVLSGRSSFIRSTLKDRFFRNPAVGYAFRRTDGAIVEYARNPQS